MEKYNYIENLCNDIREYIEDNEIEINAENREEIEEQLNEDLLTVDSVTGNGSGSYFMNAWEAEEAIAHNLDILADASEEFGGFDILKKGAEAADVTIRCYLLGKCISIVLDEIAA